MASPDDRGLPPLDYHVLLALAERQLYGYAITAAVDRESGGAVSPPAGSLYRVLARLMSQGWVAEADAPETESHPGRPRRWYALTGEGRRVLADESRRLADAATLALSRLGTAGRG